MSDIADNTELQVRRAHALMSALVFFGATTHLAEEERLAAVAQFKEVNKNYRKIGTGEPCDYRLIRTDFDEFMKTYQPKSI